MELISKLRQKIETLFRTNPPAEINISCDVFDGKLSGRSVSITGDKIIVDGKIVTSIQTCKTVKIDVIGSILELHNTSGSISVSGDVGSIDSTSGDIKIGNSVCGNVKSTSGDILVNGPVSGDVTSFSGSVRVKK